jgi:hypothetical protein
VFGMRDAIENGVMAAKVAGKEKKHETGILVG